MDSQDTKPIVVDLICDLTNIRRFRCRLTQDQIAELRRLRGRGTWRSLASLRGRAIEFQTGRWTTAAETDSATVMAIVRSFLR